MADYLSQVVSAIEANRPTAEELRNGWAAFTAAWTKRVWPTPGEICFFVRKNIEREPEPQARPALEHRPADLGPSAAEIDRRCRAIFSHPLGQQILKGGGGRQLLLEHIETGTVRGPDDLTPKIVARCLRGYAEFRAQLIELRQATDLPPTVAMARQLGETMMQRNLDLIERYRVQP